MLRNGCIEPTSKKTNKPWTVVISMLLQVTFFWQSLF